MFRLGSCKHAILLSDQIRDQRSRCSLQDARWGRSTGIGEACQALELPAAPPALQVIRDSARPVEFTQIGAHIKPPPYRWVGDRGNLVIGCWCSAVQTREETVKDGKQWSGTPAQVCASYDWRRHPRSRRNRIHRAQQTHHPPRLPLLFITLEV